MKGRSDEGGNQDLRHSLTGDVDRMSAGTVSRRLERGKEVADPNTVVAVLCNECQLRPRRAGVVQSYEVDEVVAHQDEGALRDGVEVLLRAKLDNIDKPDDVLLQDPEGKVDEWVVTSGVRARKLDCPGHWTVSLGLNKHHQLSPASLSRAFGPFYWLREDSNREKRTFRRCPSFSTFSLHSRGRGTAVQSIFPQRSVQLGKSLHSRRRETAVNTSLKLEMSETRDAAREEESGSFH
jgi:hypothetical protein